MKLFTVELEGHIIATRKIKVIADDAEGATQQAAKIFDLSKKEDWEFDPKPQVVVKQVTEAK